MNENEIVFNVNNLIKYLPESNFLAIGKNNPI